MKGEIREDNYEKRREHLKNLTDQELKEKFWSLADKIVDPIVDFAKNHTTPAIERSVLLRMGFSSIETGAIVAKIIEENLLKKGAGNVVLKLSKKENIPYKEAGKRIIDGYDIKSLF
jgi:D-ornithine 4,5-aminomutase subunit alpha